ncbi:MAG TPA: glucoamylase family protein [Candidatus Polarisedimenticolaceae bacterium]|nr:glucoamylase family protein [Candidatus Polarisedimenticolaceae bacterium]
MPLIPARPASASAGPQEPIRGELFSIERLEERAEELATQHRLADAARGGIPLAPRLLENERVLLACHRALAAAIVEERAITPAAEWLVDNFHVVKEQLREIREDLPAGFYRELPKLADGPLAGYPRVYGLAWEFVAHTDSRLEPETLCRFVRAYQRRGALTMGEIWAVAIVLRVALVENLRRLAEQIVQRRAARGEADALADALLAVSGKPVEPAQGVLRRYDALPLSESFAVQLVHRLRDQEPAGDLALRWLDERLLAAGTTVDESVRAEHQRQAATNVTVRNVITSMRLMSALDWTEFFESVSLVEQELRLDPGYRAMDFATRDRYRHAVEDLARGTALTELEVAAHALRRAHAAAVAVGGDSHEADPGYSLISDGRYALERELGFRVSLRTRLLRAYLGAATPGYVGTILLLTLALLVAPLAYEHLAGVAPPHLLLLGLLALVPASDLAIAVVNRLVTELLGPRTLPRLELRGGVPQELRTLVAVPTFLIEDSQVDEQVAALEVHYLANPDGDLRFALVSDWTDADCETLPRDRTLLSRAREGIARLNARHGEAPGGGDRFLLFHRRRLWNPVQDKWMGWERKRGKLHELNRLLRGATDTTFLRDAEDSTPPPGVRYVITLDADTQLPRGTAAKLVGTMAHRLHRPVFDRHRRRVVNGYAVLQPRVTPTMPTTGRGTPFQRIFSGPSGIDPYASAVSDVYQDLFREGSYTGKGIYEVDAFEAALAGRVPENTLLSHDLFEGIFTRAGLTSDISLFEEFPAQYQAAAARQHRWARGDWQLLPWIFGRGVPFIGRWKMLDNLRRTLSPPAAFLCLLAGWALPATSPFLWTSFILATIALSALLPFLMGLVPRRQGISKRSYLEGISTDLALGASQSALSVALLAHQAMLMGDAIVRTIVRMDVTRRRLLDWLTSAQARAAVRVDLSGSYRRMGGALLLALAAVVVVAVRRPQALPYALSFAALWLASPALAWKISLPSREPSVPEMTAGASAILRAVARRTWRYFETFVSAEDHFLPPDNYQEDPRPVLAHRTSPTNIGLYLLSTVAARDFGWIGTCEMVDRLEATLTTVHRLERFRGHLFNWYDTRDLRPLEPRYVSSVDSGNLAGHLLVVLSACRESLERSLLGRETLEGLADALTQTREAASALAAGRHTQTVTLHHLEEAIRGTEAALSPLPASLDEWLSRFRALEAHAETLADTARAIAAERGEPDGAEILVWTGAVLATVSRHRREIQELASLSTDGGVPSIGELPHLARRVLEVSRLAQTLLDGMTFEFLLDPARKLFSIGYRVLEDELDPSCYDLLASEARLTSFVAIAKGDVPSSHWFRLGRVLTPVGMGSALLSWSGSMFEYLMPALVMRSPHGSLLDRTYRLVVRRQIRYGQERGVPWGVSESAYAARDLELTYQYSSFGVPGLGLKRSLGEDVVVAPYATALAAMVDPQAASENLRALAGEGATGAYGFYDAIDYTHARMPADRSSIVVRAFMAHHQGMMIASLANVLLSGVLRTRFHDSPLVRSAELLLQERAPRQVAVERLLPEDTGAPPAGDGRPAPVVRRFTSPHDVIPRTHLLSNGKYSVMVTAAGSGYSRWRDLSVTRWREDVTADAYGSYVYVRDLGTGEVWSAAYQPTGVEPDQYSAAFSEDRAAFVRRDGTIVIRLDVAVSGEEDAEVRQVSIANRGTRTRELEVTSYLEVVLAPPAADRAHPAFAKLFVETEFVAERGTLLATRRPRSPEEPRLYAAHVAAVEGEVLGALQFETDRARFLGRGRDVRSPLSVADGRPLSDTAGAVLDPIFSLRRRLRILPGHTARIVFTTLVAPDREAALTLADKHRDPAVFDRVVALAWTQAQVQLHHLGIDSEVAHVFQRLANRLLYSDPSLRPASDVLKRSRRGPSSLWGHGISGDLPIVLVRIDEPEEKEIVRQLLRAHEYWNIKGLAVDLVILNERGSSYVQDLQSALESLVRVSQAGLRHGAHDPHGAVFLLRADLLSREDRDLLQAVARAVLVARRGSLASQVTRVRQSAAERPLAPLRSPPPAAAEPSPITRGLEFFNGLGGFDQDGREYVIVLEPGQWTPAPWINVLANPSFGCQVSEAGSGYTWSGNSRQNKLTTWSNDPVSDPAAEALFVRDEESGVVLSPTVLPLGHDGAAFVARHGHGYSRFEHEVHGIRLSLVQFVAPDAPVKVSRLVVENRSDRPRRLSATAYVEWVLGVAREECAAQTVTEVDAATGALLARNPWRQERGEGVAFLDLRGVQQSLTGDRTEFLGRNGSLARPAAMARKGALSGRVGAGLDPCGALRAHKDLAPGESAELVVLLGEADSQEAASALVARFRGVDMDALLDDVRQRWEDVLLSVQVKTPDRSMDLLLNRWLLYQTLACRLWSRAGFYQAGGAYGFRDQLQDVMALTTSRGDLARAHILRAASRQFVEGDVQHWWHPPAGQGVRTRISDDLLWLPFVTRHYLEVTGDFPLLDAEVPFLEGPALAPEEWDHYFEPAVSRETASLFEHCARAIDRSLAVGAHGLPLMGGGDWNDGMDRVGHKGKGESVWLGWFLLANLAGFAGLAAARGEVERAERWRAHARALSAAIEGEAWDGEWYLRAWFDDGTPLGSAGGDACRIDSIAQSWAVLSEAGERSRAVRAMAAVDAHLVRRAGGLILLFTPPFDASPLDPGYVQAYPPGVRENGGQYTHAAVWSVLAAAALGDGDRAHEMFTLLNPIRHGATRADVQRYRVEPYVVAGDVYSTPPHVGRGGWTWYTGSAGWMYRAGIEGILGLRLRGAALELDPSIPRGWRQYEIVLRYHGSRYEIVVENPMGVSRGVVRVELDGLSLDEPPLVGAHRAEAEGSGVQSGPIASEAAATRIPLVDDGRTHRVRVVLG